VNRRPGRTAFLLFLVLLCTAPTPGDVGGCGQTPEDLDPERFFARKQRIDCERCRECGLVTERCRLACEDSDAYRPEFPEGCYPLVHDGEVCLRALDALPPAAGSWAVA
jgi:hypothetical protein